MKRLLAAVFLIIFSGQFLTAFNSFMPPELERFGASSVYSSIQDELGAIWINTNKGIYRYNGHTLEYRYAYTNRNAFERCGQYLYIPDQHHIIRFDMRSSERLVYSLKGESFSDAVLVNHADSLMIFNGNKIYGCEGDTLILKATLDPDISVTAALSRTGGGILLGTEGHGLMSYDKGRLTELVRCNSKILKLFRSRDGNLWAGLQREGLLCIEGDGKGPMTRYDSEVNGAGLMNVRAFAQDVSGRLLIGSSNGLFSLSSDGKLDEELLEDMPGRPVHSLMTDFDGNIWIGTYYNGLLFSNMTSFPFKHIKLDPSAIIIKGLVQDRRGDVWIMTDSYGMFRYDMDRKVCSLIEGTKGNKYQCACYDPETDTIWAGEFQTALISYNIRTGATRTFRTEDIRKGQSIQAILKYDGELLIGKTDGLYRFDPVTESTISRKIDGLSTDVYDLEPGPDGKIWISSSGIYTYDGTDGIKKYSNDNLDKWTGNRTCYDISFDEQGAMWIAVAQKGVVSVHGDDVRYYDKATAGLLDNYVTSVTPVSKACVLVSMDSGISIIADGDKCYNYSISNGLKLRSARRGPSLVLDDGSIWIGGNDGIESLPAGSGIIPPGKHDVRLDGIQVNGERYDIHTSLPFLDKIVLSHDQTNFSFDVSTYDYAKTEHVSLFYKLDGYDKDWIGFNESESPIYKNMSPGTYNFRVRKTDQSGNGSTEDSVIIRIKPVWYSTLPVRLGIILLLLSTAAIILYSKYSRIKLTNELKHKQKENEEKTRFFVDISYNLRTPLNLIIGQLESFFHKYGSKTAGIEDIEDIYAKAKQMRGLISDFVDVQNEELMESHSDPESRMNVKNAKFLNAAVGAVERNLYNKDLNVSLLCTELNMGKTTLSSKLKNASGLSPREFIEDIRLTHAAQMLSDGIYRVSEIADRMAFCSPKYFGQRFKSKYGVSPKDYCKQVASSIYPQNQGTATNHKP